MSLSTGTPTRKSEIERLLGRQAPARILFAPNYWQWFTHQRHHGRLPPEIARCRDQLDLIRHLGLDVFSRNIYCDQAAYWFGGLAEEVLDGGRIRVEKEHRGKDIVTTRRIDTGKGTLTERLRYVHAESTIVQEKFLVDDTGSQLPVLEEFIRTRHWRFNETRYRAQQKRVGNDGLVIAGELYSPLKMLHLVLGPVNATYLTVDQPEAVQKICALHEKAQLELARRMAAAGVKVLMAMDNLDTLFHPPHYVERHSAGFYREVSRICHAHGAAFFIHACGKQKANLELIRSLGVDGLEGVAHPPLGDVTMVEALEMTGERFIITGGISAAEIENLVDREQVFAYVAALFADLRPYRHRFVFSAGCNTPINTSFAQIRWFRDAWDVFKD